MVYGRLKLLYSHFYYATHCKRKKMVNVCINRGPEFTCYLNCYHRGKIDRLPFSSNHFHMNVKKLMKIIMNEKQI